MMHAGETYRYYICNATIEVALVILDGNWSVLLDSLHSQRAVKLTDNRVGGNNVSVC